MFKTNTFNSKFIFLDMLSLYGMTKHMTFYSINATHKSVQFNIIST